MCEPCPAGIGKGRDNTTRTISDEVLELQREAKQFDPPDFRIVAGQAVIDRSPEEESQHLAVLDDFIGNGSRYGWRRGGNRNSTTSS
jgi:ribonuclease G